MPSKCISAFWLVFPVYNPQPSACLVYVYVIFYHNWVFEVRIALVFILNGNLMALLIDVHNSFSPIYSAFTVLALFTHVLPYFLKGVV